MKTLLTIILTVAATITTTAAQSEEKKSDAETAVQGAMVELREVPNDMKLIDDSNKKLAISNQTQTDTTKMINALEQKIRNDDAPALMTRARKFDESVQNALSRGCGANQTTDPNLANYCNTENEKARLERDAILAAQAAMSKQMQMIADTRKAVADTTVANAAQTKKNNAAFNDLLAKKMGLQSVAITRSMSIVKSRAIAGKACKTLSPLEKASCCLSVVSDGRDPAQCDVELLFNLFEGAGAFGSNVVKPGAKK
ncbi:MAG TPA: hypothetical protein VF928_05555 [Usitatibacteraceae bacterium]